MRKLYFILFFLMSFISVNSQTLQLTGRIRCSNDLDNWSSKGAENIIVIPSAIPQQSVITGSEPSGFFIIDTNIKKESLYDKSLRLLIYTRCKTCKSYSINKFISPDQIVFRNSIPQIQLKTKYIKELCDSIEFQDFSVDSILTKIYSIESDEYGNDYVENDHWVASPGLLNLLMLLGPLAPQEPDSIVTDILTIDRTSNPEINYGKFLLHSSFVNSSNAGFNFAPARDFSEASFWNPSSMFSFFKRAGIYGTTNWRNQLKLSAFLKFNKKIGVSCGFLNSFQREYRYLYNSEIETGNEPKSIFKLNEYSLYSSVCINFFEPFAMGFTVKYLKQKFDNPQLMERTREYLNGEVRDVKYEIVQNESKHSKYDLDISCSFNLNRSINLGINFMNVFNSSLVANNFLENEKKQMINQFTIGSGVSYKYQRFNFGTDLLFYNNSIYNLSFGLSYVPFDRALIQTSFSTRENVYSLSFKYHRFKLSFINNKNLLKIESKDYPKTIEKPYFYSSFVIDF